MRCKLGFLRCSLGHHTFNIFQHTCCRCGAVPLCLSERIFSLLTAIGLPSSPRSGQSTWLTLVWEATHQKESDYLQGKTMSAYIYPASRDPNFSSGMRTNPGYSCKMGKTSGFSGKHRVFSQSACWGQVDWIPLHAEQSGRLSKLFFRSISFHWYGLLTLAWILSGQVQVWGRTRDFPVLNPWFTRANPWFPWKTPSLLKNPIFSNPWFTRAKPMIYPCKPVKKITGLRSDAKRLLGAKNANLLMWHP